MTPKQKEIRDFIARFLIENGFSPSLQEIAEAIGKRTSKSHISRMVNCLVRDGHLTKAPPGAARTLGIPQAGGGDLISRLSPALVVCLDEYCRQHRVSRETVVTEALSSYLGLTL